MKIKQSNDEHNYDAIVIDDFAFMMEKSIAIRGAKKANLDMRDWGYINKLALELRNVAPIHGATCNPQLLGKAAQKPTMKVILSVAVLSYTANCRRCSRVCQIWFFAVELTI